MQTKYLFITGGVCSSLGKGLTAASIGLLLEKRGIEIALLKLDPYLNVDPGTMSPFQHGEVYVTDDGAETDLDLGHYYRYTNTPLSQASNATSGQIYDTVIKRERKGDYLGKTVQVIPHITDEIKRRILLCGKQQKNIQVVLVEIGGTTGDIESLPFLEAIRQFRHEHPQDCLNIHLTYVPYLRAAGELKTKPTQHSVQVLREIGIFPDIIICRSEETLTSDVKDKISLFCNVQRDAVIEEVDVSESIYEVPLKLHEQNLDEMVGRLLNLPLKKIELQDWKDLLEKIMHPKGEVTIGVVGKYVQHKDAYKSVFEALHHGANSLGYKLKIQTFEADKIDQIPSLEKHFESCDGFLVPGGYGERGWEGKISCARFARKNRIPFFGICLGMQVMAVEYARDVLGLTFANSTEIDPSTPDPVIALMGEQEKIQDLGGTMRLGAFPCSIKPKTLAYAAYRKDLIEERHRHRYELNNSYIQNLEKHGFIISGEEPNRKLSEIAEIKDHPWMIGVQFHPEFKSKPTDPHPLFREFISAAIQHRKNSKSS